MEQNRWLVDAKVRQIKHRLSQLLAARGAVAQAARACQVHRTTVSNWKSANREAMPNIAEAGLMCEHLGISLDQLYSGLPSEVKGRELPEEIQDIVWMMMQTDERTQNMVRSILNGAILMQSYQLSEQKSEQRDSG